MNLQIYEEKSGKPCFGLPYSHNGQIPCPAPQCALRAPNRPNPCANLAKTALRAPNRPSPCANRLKQASRAPKFPLFCSPYVKLGILGYKNGLICAPDGHFGVLGNKTPLFLFTRQSIWNSGEQNCPYLCTRRSF